LIGILGGQETPAIGFGSGIERMILELKKQEAEINPSAGPDIVVVTLGDAASAGANLAIGLRAANVSTVLAPSRSMKAQMRYANQQNASNVVIIGDREVENSVASVKNLAQGGDQSEVALDAAAIAEHVRAAGNQ
jgi:histidyl-tRNA synthetase